MQVKLTKVVRKTTDKEGNALKTKDGRPYTRLSIKTQEHGDKWLSGFDGFATKNWKEGDTVEIEVEEKGEYLNFKVPKKEDKVDEKMEMILNRIVGLQLQLTEIISYTKPKARKDLGEADDYPTPESEGIDLDDPDNI